MKSFQFVLPVLLAATAAPAAETSPFTTITVQPPPPIAHVEVRPPPTGIRTAITPPVSLGRPHACADLYPRAAIDARAEGITTLTFIVTTEGSTRDIKVFASSGNADLDAAAVACAGRWRYQPQTENGVPEEARWEASVEWKLFDLRR